MKVLVKLFATLQDLTPAGIAPGHPFPVNLENGTIANLIKVLRIPRKLAKFVMVNKRQVTDFSTDLHEGDEIIISPPVGGG